MMTKSFRSKGLDFKVFKVILGLNNAIEIYSYLIQTSILQLHDGLNHVKLDLDAMNLFLVANKVNKS